MGIKSAILLAGYLSATTVTVSSAVEQPAENDKQSRFLRKNRHQRRLVNNKQRPTRKKKDMLHSNNIDITAEDVGFWTRSLQSSLPPSNPPVLSPTNPPVLSPTDPPVLSPTDPPVLSPTDPPVPAPVPTNPPVIVDPTDPPVVSSIVPTPAPSTEEPTISPSGSPTFPCNLTPDERATQIKTLVSTVSDPATFNDPTSPQSLALNWITNDDAIEPVLCPNEIGEGCSRGGTINPMIQRYALAVFYFATNGDTTWNQCSAAEDVGNAASVAEADANCERQVTPFGVANTRVGDTSTDAWLDPVNECEWGGAACWGSDTPNLNLCLDQLDFENDGLSGELVPELSVLSSLRFLILEQGEISGPIPDSYGELERLLILDMDFNQLSGALPETLYDLTSLQQLDLNDNQITGSISPKIGDLSLLTFFQIDHNLLSETIPSEMGQLSNLRIAFLSANEITGTMPAQVCALRNNTSPPGVLGVLVTDCAGDPPEVTCPCCSSCA